MIWDISSDADSILSSRGISIRKELDCPTKYVPSSVKEDSVLDCSQSAGITLLRDSMISSFDKFFDNIKIGSWVLFDSWGLPSSNADLGTSLSTKLYKSPEDIISK